MEKASTGLFGSLSGLLVAMLLQPLENVKMALMLPPKDLATSRNVINNFSSAFKYIQSHEGTRGFFKGTVPSILRAAVGSFFFFGSLRHLESATSHLEDSPSRNFLCSGIARVISSIVSNPINVIETRFEMTNFHGYSSILDGVIKITSKEGPLTFFKGGLTSCFKEGSFAGIYYMLYQAIKDHGVNKLAAGWLSGVMSTAISHPFEIARAKLQTEGVRDVDKKESLFDHLRGMRRNGGWFKGLAPRLIKKPLSNALTFALFETLEARNTLVTAAE